MQTARMPIANGEVLAPLKKITAKALKDTRACKYQVDESNNFQWIPCSKQAKRRDVQENSQSSFCDGTFENVAEFIDVEEVCTTNKDEVMRILQKAPALSDHGSEKVKVKVKNVIK
ncbi:hypothetical protein Y032_0146g2523 [Ancylostoma ceylanicum]|nr:hypothetical protein Y032_0146g2523 [Ancylostoma ceylanicum]